MLRSGAGGPKIFLSGHFFAYAFNTRVVVLRRIDIGVDT
jgi:hypothetical protein